MNELPFEKRNKQAIIFVGIQASGKTTFYEKMLSDGIYTHIGIGMYFQDEVREGFNPITKEKTSYSRRALHIDLDLPVGQDYSRLIETIVDLSNEMI